MKADLRFSVRIGENEYPMQLAELTDPPEVLYGIGDPKFLNLGLAVIGARRATPYGLRCARLFAGWAGQHRVVVVSGAAIGCDSEAQAAALDAGGPTVAVLGCGPDIDYPRRSGKLLHKIREQYAVVSEMPFGREPTRWSFVRRNRIIAGLSKAVLVVEAGLPSGTFSTADAALDSGREVLVVPGSIFSPSSRGANRLIRQGAVSITDVSELAQALGIEGTCEVTCVKAGDEPMRILAADPMRPDDFARALGIDIVSAARTLGSMEARGLITRYADGRYGLR